MRVGNHIRHLRKSQKLTQEELASGICSVTYLSKLENHKELPSEEILQLLCERLGVELGDILKTFEDLESDLLEWYRIIELKDQQAASAKREEIQKNIDKPELFTKNH